MEKKCTKCLDRLSLGNFCKDSKSKDGLQSQCKKCKSTQLGKYYKTERGKLVQRENAIKNYYKNVIAFNMSRRIRKSLGKDKGGISWEEVVGYTLDDLKNHLESKFQNGMNWDNHGDWHIDHIRPISTFNITSINCEDFKDCWSLNNLQPLWAKDNLTKSNKFTPII